MISHVILFAVLSILSAVAINAAGKPISKSPMEQEAPAPDEKHDVTPS
ncbi:Uncharacterised protein [Halioglobus japonicus]|nr:Uncharacterised protein [Halioglobus japonicus]